MVTNFGLTVKINFTIVKTFLSVLSHTLNLTKLHSHFKYSNIYLLI